MQQWRLAFAPALVGFFKLLLQFLTLLFKCFFVCLQIGHFFICLQYFWILLRSRFFKLLLQFLILFFKCFFACLQRGPLTPWAAKYPPQTPVHVLSMPSAHSKHWTTIEYNQPASTRRVDHVQSKQSVFYHHAIWCLSASNTFLKILPVYQCKDRQTPSLSWKVSHLQHVKFQYKVLT